MEEKMINKYGIRLDGRMDESIWDTVETQTGFHKLNSQGGAPAEAETEFKVLPCADRIYVGIKFLEPEGMEKILEARNAGNGFMSSSVEMFFSPSGTDYEFYQFLATINGQRSSQYYSEGGNIKPDKYAPDWDFAVYIGETYWSIEVELPLTAFYWTPHTRWSDKWLLNIARNRRVSTGGMQYSTWSRLHFGFLEPSKFRSMEGFPIRPVENDVCIVAATAELTEQTADGYQGIMTVKASSAVADTFDFVSDHGETVTVSLDAGSNEFTAPCFFDKLGRTRVMLSLVRKSDGYVFKRYYPVLAEYEPIKIRFTLPEYRNNFYPGQDYSKIVGTVITRKSVTLKLEGPGIETTVLTPNADGSFQFDTPNFEIGDAYLTATIDGYELTKKIRRLAPTGHMMTWISGGNLIVNGKPTLRRDMYARYYRVGTAFKRRYDADNLHETWLESQSPCMHASDLVRGSEGAGGEATKDGMPSEEMLRKVDEIIEKNKDKDFAYYYLTDEPECRGLSTVYFKNYYNYVAEKDPYHVVLISTRNADSSVDMADWFETHPYICPYNHEDGSRVYLRPLHALGKFVDDIVNLDRPDKCIGFLPTCYGSGGATYGWDYPTFDEYICHTWAAMMRGGKTLWPYAGHDLNDRASLYEGTRYVFSSFEALEDLVLMGKRTTLTKSTDAEAVLYDNGDEKMFVLVNLTQQPQTVTLDDLTGTWHEFRGSRTFTGKTFELKPLETVIGTNVVKGADLPTYAETAALIDKLEYERTHTGSLLFNRNVNIMDIGVTSSKVYGLSKTKLFDGVRDNLAFEVREDGDGFVELNLSKVKLTFDKVVVYGHKIDDMEIKIRNNDELSAPAVAKKETTEFSTTFILPEKITPDALCMEFCHKGVEFYEIELF